FGEKVMGSAYGAVFLISTLGMGLGSWAGGFIHDAFGTYAWLFISSAAIGLMAMVLALTFRAPRLAAAVRPAAVPANSEALGAPAPLAVDTFEPGMVLIRRFSQRLGRVRRPHF